MGELGCYSCAGGDRKPRLRIAVGDGHMEPGSCGILAPSLAAWSAGAGGAGDQSATANRGWEGSNRPGRDAVLVWQLDELLGPALPVPPANRDF